MWLYFSHVIFSTRKLDSPVFKYADISLKFHLNGSRFGKTINVLAVNDSIPRSLLIGWCWPPGVPTLTTYPNPTCERVPNRWSSWRSWCLNTSVFYSDACRITITGNNVVVRSHWNRKSVILTKLSSLATQVSMKYCYQTAGSKIIMACACSYASFETPRWVYTEGILP